MAADTALFLQLAGLLLALLSAAVFLTAFFSDIAFTITADNAFIRGPLARVHIPMRLFIVNANIICIYYNNLIAISLAAMRQPRNMADIVSAFIKFAYYITVIRCMIRQYGKNRKDMEAMKYKMKSILSALLAGTMMLTLSACAAKDSEQGVAISGESVDINGMALRPDGEAASIYTNKGMKLLVPLEYNELLAVDTPQDDGATLFTVSEKASIEADKAQGGSGDGAGWLFSIGMISESQLYDMLCGDMSGVEVFAKDADGVFYAFYHPTDVRLVRESYDNAEDMEQWSALNEWASGSVRDTFVKENSGLTVEAYGNADLQIYLARAVLADDTAYAISPSTWRPVMSNGVDGRPFAMKLIRNARIEALDAADAPDGEYVFLNFPDDDMRFDFFLAEGCENVYRQVWSGSEQLFQISFADDTIKASDVMREWYDALAEADMARGGYTPDDLIGVWAEKIAGRGVITVTKNAEGAYDLLVEWANSAAEQYVWEMTAEPAGEGGVLRYENGRHVIRTYDSEGKFTEEVRYENGSGELSLNSAFELMWQDDVDGAGDDTVFVNAE